MMYYDLLFIRLHEYAKDPKNKPNPYIKPKENVFELTLAQISLPKETYKPHGYK